MDRHGPRVPRRVKVPPEASAAWATLLRLYPEIEGIKLRAPNGRGVLDIGRCPDGWSYVHRRGGDPADDLDKIVAYYVQKGR